VKSKRLYWSAAACVVAAILTGVLVVGTTKKKAPPREPLLAAKEQEGPDDIVQYVIYDRPTDYPFGYVVRKVIIRRGNSNPIDGGVVGKTATMTEARTFIPAGKTLLPRMPGELRQVAEVYM